MFVDIVDSWDSELSKLDCSQKDIYFCESYIKLYENAKKKAKCVICADGDHIMLFPFLREQTDGYYDFETAYGYGGPITNCEDSEWLKAATAAMEDKLKNEKYICGFVRFHPLLENEKYWENSPRMQILRDRQTVCMDLNHSEESIWNEQISSKNRNMIRKAIKNNLEYRVESEFDSIEEFIAIYDKTMKRLQAEEFYLFSTAYYADFMSSLKGNSFLATVRQGETLLCGALFMFSGKMGHYHLAGSNEEYRSLGANNFMLWETARRLREMGIERFHLGGGSDSNAENSLLKFKTSFSRHLCQFSIGKLILDNAVYGTICENWERENPDKVPVFGNRLLKYKY